MSAKKFRRGQAKCICPFAGPKPLGLDRVGTASSGHHSLPLDIPKYCWDCHRPWGPSYLSSCWSHRPRRCSQGDTNIHTWFLKGSGDGGFRAIKSHFPADTHFFSVLHLLRGKDSRWNDISIFLWWWKYKIAIKHGSCDHPAAPLTSPGICSCHCTKAQPQLQ